MNSIISRLLTVLAALLMLVSMAACKPYPERIDFKSVSMHYRWPIEFGEISVNNRKMRVLGHGASMVNMPPQDNKDVASFSLTWVEFHSKRSFKVRFDVPISKLLGSKELPYMAIIKIEIGRHGEVIVSGPKNGSFEEIEILRICGLRTPDVDASFIDQIEYLSKNTNFNDPKRLALPLPDSSCPDPGY